MAMFKNLFTKTLFYPGDTMKNILKTEFDNYKKILDNLKISYILMPEEEVSCGITALHSGHRRDVKELAQKNFDAFKKKKITKIITNSPESYHMFNSIYPKLIRDWDISVEHVTVTILNSIKKRKIKIPVREIVMYHDSSYLGRYEEIYDQPRRVIERLGGELIEMKNNRENAMSCGGNGGVYDNFPEIAKKSAENWVKQVPKKAKKIIVTSGMCYLQLSKADDRTVEFSTYVLGKLRSLSLSK